VRVVADTNVIFASMETSTPGLRDCDDEAVLACALAARAELIVSGDDDLRALGSCCLTGTGNF
jgi:predicted nucleic acid-binding protein